LDFHHTIFFLKKTGGRSEGAPPVGAGITLPEDVIILQFLRSESDTFQ